MSIATTQQDIDYPESDGKPIGETDLHRDWMFQIFEILRYQFRDQRVYVASDLLVYYEPGVLTKFVVPDVFLVFDCDPGRRRIFKTWEEARVPNLVFEVTSRGTSSSDLTDKPRIYQQIGVQEYFLFDPTGSYLTPMLQGYRLIDGDFVTIPESSGKIHSDVIGANLRLVDDELEFIDAETGARWLDRADAEAFAREQERLAKESERAAREREREAKEREHEARLIAEARVQELEEQLRQLRLKDSDTTS